MSGYNWPSQFTYRGRYEQIGVTDRILEYTKLSPKKKFKILDVGCSVGLAIKTTQENLKKMGFDIETTGMDNSDWVENEAKKNLDHFILGNITTVESTEGFDIVICSKMSLFAGAKIKTEIIGKCAKFLLSDGALITDANNYRFPSMKENFLEDFHDTIKTFRGVVHGLKSLRKVIKEIQELRLKKKMYLIVGQKEAEKYAESIWQGWKKLNPFDQLLVIFDNATHRLSTHLNNKPDYKKRG